MSRGPSIVVADDLTGAAEVAAIAHQAGRRALVLNRPLPTLASGEVLVLNTDARLLSPAKARDRLKRWGGLLAERARADVFLKVDSVLRGPVPAYIEALSTLLGTRRTLLVPANPSLGRVIHHGRYTIHGTPLEETVFGRDPHHPRHTSDVVALLGANAPGQVACLSPGEQALPKSGIILGETAEPDDAARWAQRLSPDMLAAGGADFFRAWLGDSPQPVQRATRVLFDRGTLLLHGTTTHLGPPNARLFRGSRAPALAPLVASLREHGYAAIAVPPRRLASLAAPARISQEFGRLASALHGREAFRHLLIAGGATAAAVLQSLGWHALEVLRVWAPGVVTLRPLDAPDASVTLKPGSYPWPPTLIRRLPAGLLS